MSNQFVHSQVRDHNGAPALFLDGEPTFPLLLMTGSHALKDLQEVTPTEVHLLTEVFSLGWEGPNQYDYTAFDAAIQSFLEADPHAYFLPRVHLDAPESWMAAHPDELIGYSDPAVWTEESCWGPVRSASLASRIYRDAAAEALRQLIRHAKDAEYANRILGWHIGAGVYGEWHYTNAVYYPDTSPAFVNAYREWLAARYSGETIEPRIPTIEERKTADLGVFRDPAIARWMYDHSEFFHRLGAEMLSELAAVVKEETEGRSIVLAFNGYFPELDVNHEIDHRAFEIAVNDPNVDAFSSPHTYGRRKPGEDAAMRGFLGSVRAKGKLWVNEADERTHIAHPTQWKHVETLDEGVELLWRSFAHAVTHNCGLWFMDQGGMWFMQQSGSWYQHETILSAFTDMKRIGAQSMLRQRTRQSEVAVVANLKTAFFLAERGEKGIDHVTNTLMNEAMMQITRCGAPFDVHVLSQLFGAGVPDYKTYIFLDVFLLTDQELAQIKALRDFGKTVVFFYAPAILSEQGISLERMRDLLGIDVEMTDAMLLPDGTTQSPGFVVPNAQGNYAQAGTVFYSAAPVLSSADLRAILRTAGVHIYLESNDTVMVGGGYLALHADTDGERTLHLKNPARVTNVRTGEIREELETTITASLKHGETLLLQVDV